MKAVRFLGYVVVALLVAFAGLMVAFPNGW